MAQATFATHATVQQDGQGNPFLVYNSQTGAAVFQVSSAGLVSAPGLQLTVVALTGSTDALSAHGGVNYMVNSTGIDAMTLAAPTATTDDGKLITVTSTTAHAHTITATSLLNNGGTGVPYTTATFTAHAGASITLMAYQGLWYLVTSTNVTLS